MILIISIVSFNLLTGAESPVSEKGRRISNIEYNGTLKYERYFLRKPPSFLTPKPYPLTPSNGYVSWTPHRAGNLLTGEDAVSGGWGGGLSGSFQGTSGLLKGVGLNGGLSFQPGSGVGVNMNVNFPGTLGLPRGSFLGINYQTGSGNYTASGGFSLYQNGNSSTGISISASNSGYANVGLNYNKDGNSFLNRLQGYSLNIGSDGLLSLHNQFRGADVLSLGYNFNTHSFDPIGINQNFQNDYNNSVTQENAAANAAASAEKLAEKRQEWLDQQRTKPGYEGLSDQAVFDKYKLENSGAGGSRLDLPSQVFGSLGDMFGGSLGLFNSSGEGYLNSQGEFVPRTCFTAGTLVHTKTGVKKIEEIQVGDEVLSWDEESGEQEYHRVVKTFQRQANVVYTIVYSNGTQVETTDEHPFYIEGKGWVPAKDLRAGEFSVLSNERTLEIVSIAISERTTTVYNFEVEDSHSYYVSEVGILVHNDCVITGPSIFGRNSLLDSGLTAGLVVKLAESGADTVKFGLDLASCFSGNCSNIGSTIEALGIAIDQVRNDPNGTSDAAKQALDKFKADLNGVNGSVKQGEAIGSILNLVPWIALSKSSSVLNMADDIGGALANAGKVLDKGDLTKAGRALEKHGNRSGSIFPQATGNAASKNAQGQKVLEEILASKQKRVVSNRFGGKDIFDASTGRGARFDGEGNMMGFLEP
ncbi:TIGR04388 family protein [Leptospira weilii]|uniref:TIGR04388 family protein n=1 Tax=Leptospira weilii TaxID=28184 RepID=UPI001F330450|nr:Hint domain-containing protein [Leptospira weilii]